MKLLARVSAWIVAIALAAMAATLAVGDSRATYVVGLKVADHLQVVEASPRQIQIFITDHQLTSSASRYYASRKIGMPSLDGDLNPIGNDLHFLGFRSRRVAPWRVASAHEFRIPTWSLTVPLIYILATGYRRWCRRWARIENGLCLRCGYDLRESPNGCPECGAPTPAR